MSKPKVTNLPNFTEINGKLYVRVNYRNADGKWRSKTQRVSSQREGLNLIAKLKHELHETGSAAFDGEKMMFEELLAEYKRAHPNKPKWYLEPIEQFFKGRRIRKITYGDCAGFKASREKIKDRRYKCEKPPDRTIATINRELDPLRSILLFAVRHGWLSRNPFTAGPPLILKSEEQSRDRLPTPAEETRILAACVPPREHLRGLVIATLDTGLRRSALRILTWSCIDFENSLLRVPSGNRYKKRPKVIGMTARLKAELETLFEKSDKQPETKIFRKVNDFKRSWKTACKKAEVEGLRFNDLRHGFSTGLMEAGIPRDLAMKAAGHSNPEIHDIYTNIDQRIARQIAEALDKLYQSRESKSREGNSDLDPGITDGTQLIN